MKECRRAVAALLLPVVLAGCGAQAIREDAQVAFRAGEYEQALKLYREGLARYPENVTLKSGLVSAEDAAVSRLLTEANAARTAGDSRGAEERARRALQIKPNAERARAILLDIERDARQRVALSRARELIGNGFVERASIVIENALKDEPRNAELLALQRRLELDAKQAEAEAVQLSETRPISLDFRNANLRTVLEVITRNCGVNFVIDKDVRSDIQTTVFLQQSRLPDVLELLTSTNQLGYKVIDATTVMIYPRTPDKLKEYQDLVVRAFYLTNADVKQTASLLKSMLKVREPFVDEKLNMVMIRESAQTVRLAERMIALHDLPESEVLMEVEVLEVKRSSLTELGIKYPDGFTLTPIPPTGSKGFTLGNVGSLNSNSIGIGLPDVTLNLHRDVGDVNILANPRIRARNREKAKIMIGDKLPVITTTGNATNSGFISESVQYVDVGLKLDVEPNIHLDDEVAIKVALEVSSLVREIKTASGSLVYQIGTRSANTVLRLRDGETQLLAGLISNEERMSANRVPGLGDLPMVGRLFASQRDDGQRTEIVLSVTPRIVRNVRRPDLNQTELWSGTENEVRSRPLAAVAPRKQETAASTAPPVTPAAGIEPSVEASPAAASAGAGPVNLSLNGPAEVAVGATFEVQVAIDSQLQVRGMPLQLRFPAQLLQVEEAEAGDFFAQNGGLSQTKTLDQQQGLAAIAVMRNSADGVAGGGAVARFRFKALAPGEAHVSLDSAKVDGAELPSLPLPQPLTVKVR
ncbi:cohesin domain-containing protein [Massilia sp. METH4]|uniref:cohesin domain-containing protein n=1 Tax=Massilia sp. METH4 TaxID=3123041 RepID=UPI0030D2717A